MSHTHDVDAHRLVLFPTSAILFGSLPDLATADTDLGALTVVSHARVDAS